MTWQIALGHLAVQLVLRGLSGRCALVLSEGRVQGVWCITHHAGVAHRPRAHLMTRNAVVHRTVRLRALSSLFELPSPQACQRSEGLQSKSVTDLSEHASAKEQMKYPRACPNVGKV